MRVHGVDRVLGVIPEDSVFYQHTGSGLEKLGNNCHNNSLRFEREYLYRQCGGIMLVKRNCYDNEGAPSCEKKGHIVLSENAATRVTNAFEMKVAELITGLIK
jgi:hypothetical protein